VTAAAEPGDGGPASTEAAASGELLTGIPDPGVFDDPVAVAACFEDLPACMFVVEGPDHVFAAVNRAGRDVLDAREVVGLPVRQAFPEPAGQRLAEMLDRAYTAQCPVSGREWRVLLHRDDDGELEELHLDVTAVPTRRGAGEERGVVVHAIDVTARRAAEARVTAVEQRYQAALDVVTTLQRSLLPEWLPVLPGLGIAARYLVADSEQGAGGDWFDAVPLGDGRLGLVVGDVVGSGPRACAVMGRLRAVLTELFLDAASLSEVVDRLDRYASRVRGAAATTVFLAVLDPADGRLDYAGCGHPPPLVVGADGRARYLPVGSGRPLGVVATTTPAVVQTAWLQAADVLLLYTDGLLEQPDRTLGEGLDLLRLVASDARTNGSPPLTAADQVCELTMGRMSRDGHTDDATMLAVHRTGTLPGQFRADVPASPGALAPLRDRLDDWLTSLGGSDDDALAIRFAVLEAVTNVIEHAYPDDAGPVSVEGVLDSAGRVCTTVTDLGSWAPPPPEPGSRGRGLVLMRECMDSVEIDSTATGTAVLMDRELRRLPVVGTDAAGPRRPAHDGGVGIESGEGSTRHVTVRGPVDLSTAADVHQRLQEAGRGGAVPLTVDLTGVSHLASAGVQLLYQLAEQAVADGQQLRLIAPRGGAAHQVLALTALNRLAVVADTPDDLPR
jgi:anti-anti-sigma factor